MRLNVDVRRHWRCPACRAERRLPATVTTVKCACAGTPQMQLVEGQRRDRTPVPLPEMVLEFDLSADPVTIPENLPVPDPNQRMGRPGPRGRRHGGPDQGPPSQSPQSAPQPGAPAGPGPHSPDEGMNAGPSQGQDSRRGDFQRRGDGPPNQGPGPRSRRSRDRPKREGGQAPPPPAGSADSNELQNRRVNESAPTALPSEITPPPPPAAEDFGAGLENSGG